MSIPAFESRRRFLADSLYEAQRCANYQSILDLRIRLQVYSLPLRAMDKQHARIYLQNSALLADSMFKENANSFWNECQRASDLLQKERG